MKEKLIDNAVLAETKLTELKGRLIQLANTIGQTDLGTFAYGYDNPLLGQRTSMTSSLGATNYSYDSNYQLTGATYPNVAPFNGEVHGWTYDNIGNRLTNTVNSSTANYTYFKNGGNPLNGQRLQSDGAKTYTYDANGNVTGDGTYSYTWDYENRLTGISGGGLIASYSYDYEGRRKSKTVNGVTTNYLYDGQNLVREMSTANADYVFGPAIDEPLAQNRAGVTSYYAVDALASTTALDDQAGSLQNTYTYDAWGVIRNQTGSTPNSFGYTSREFAEAGLNFYRARYYNPSIGRFISEDPIPYSERTISEGNSFAYVVSNPLSFRDPKGESIMVCCRKANWLTDAVPGPGNHCYLWDTRDRWDVDLKCCARGHTFRCREIGPGTGFDKCYTVPNSEGKEEQIMSCCRLTADDGVWIGFYNDCQTSIDRCLKRANLSSPGDFGRTGPPCSKCPDD